jgi:Rod binding domain-containing protein
MTDAVSAAPLPRTASAAASADTARPRQLAAEMEAAFLSEMLALTGLGRTSESFGGGIGEDQFASFLRQEQARAMVRAGGIGLAETLFRTMTGTADAGR